MLWNIQHAKSIEFYERISETNGESTPLDYRPKIDHECYWYLDAFFLLSGSRNINLDSPERISLSEMVTYANAFGTIEDSVKDFCFVISQIDNEYIDYILSKRPKPKKIANRK